MKIRYIISLLAFLAFAAPGLYAASVNINTASAQEIATALFGVGPGKARAIVEYRTAHGPFKVAEELMKISGIGPKTVASIRHNLQFGTAIPGTKATP